MELPFPSMDPYLEASSIWPDVHHRLITAISNQIGAQLTPSYTAVITPYIALESIEIAPARRAIVPDIGIFGRDAPDEGGVAVALAPAPLTLPVAITIPTRYAQLDIRALDGDVLITTIELLSPANKRPGADGAAAYDTKRQEVLQSSAHLLEIDLLRVGQRPRMARALPDAPYFIFLSRAAHRPVVEVWPLSLRAPIPRVPVPLRAPDPDVVLDLTRALRQIYADARYERRIDYHSAPPPPDLSAADDAWLDTHLRAQGLRP